MPRYFPPHPYTDPAAIRAGTAKHIRFVVFRKAVFSFWGVPPSYFSSSLRRTCNTRKRRKSACNAAIPAAASIRGNTAKRLPGLARFFRLPPDSGRRTPQPLPPGQPPGPSPASRFVSRPSGYSTTPSFGESEGSRWPSPSRGSVGLTPDLKSLSAILSVTSLKRDHAFSNISQSQRTLSS